MLLQYLQRRFLEFVYDERGADLAEYALLLALVAVVAYAVIKTLGEDIANVFETLSGFLKIGS